MATNQEIVDKAQQLYVSYYGRPADPGGLAFWIEYFTETDDEGRFMLERPPGAYRVEFFSDDLTFRPAMIDVESPLDDILTVAEPL